MSGTNYTGITALRSSQYECEPSGSVGNEGKKSSPSGMSGIQDSHPQSLIGHLLFNRPNPWMQAVAMLSSDENFFFLNENSYASNVGNKINRVHSAY